MIDREFRVMRALSGSAVPVPRMILLDQEANPMGREFYIMEHLEGRIFWDPTLPEVPERKAIYDAMNGVLADLARVDPPGVGLSDFGRADGYFERQTALWSRQYAASVATPNPRMIALGQWLASQRVKPADAEYVARYCDRRGMVGVDDWSAWLVLSAYRLAAILAGVGARAAAGNASNPEQGRAYGALVPELIALGESWT